MSAEGMPHEPSIFAAPLAWISQCALAAPRATILLGVAAAALSVMYAVLCLGFRTSRLDLLNPQSEWNQRWLAYLDEFGDQDDAVIVVEGANEAAVIQAIIDLAAELQRDTEHFSSVFHRVELGRVRSKSLHLAPPEQLAQVEAFVGQAEPILRGDWQQLRLDYQLPRLAGALAQLPAEAPQRKQVAEQFQRMSAGVEAALAQDYQYQSPWPGSSADEERLSDRYLLADQGRLGMVLVRLIGTDGADEDHHRSLAKLRELMPVVEARHANVTIGVTGMPVLEHDEMQTSQRDMSWTSIVSTLGVVACFWAAFGGWRHAALALGALMISICWAFAFVTGAVGHLNLLSVSFASVLIGQGIDFGIHYVAAYLRARQHADCLTALRQTSLGVGPGIFTGGLTTAAAFCMTLLTDFTGLRELGLIAGGGILICTIGALVLLPPLIRWSDEGRAAKPVPQIVPMQFLTWPMHTLPRLTIAMLLGFTAFCGVGLLKLRYDHNLLHLQSRGLPSVELERTLIERADRSVWFALSMCDSRADLLARKAKFEELESVSHTEEIGSLLPADASGPSAQVANIRRGLALVPEKAPRLEAVNAVVLTQTMTVLASAAPECQRLVEQLNQTGASEASLRLTRYQQQSADELVARLQTLRASADPAPPQLADLPKPLTDRFVGQHGKYLLKVYASGDVWDIEKLQRFVADTESIDPAITGHPIQTYYASSQMQRSYIHAGIYAFAAMLIAVIVDLRRVRATLLAVAPMALGLIQTFGLLGWLGIPLNAANMIVLPLIFGIGIDDGVHLLHDYFQHRGRYRLDNATFVAVLLTSVTTMVGFGSLVLSQHQGLRSLGQVLTLGVMCCLMSSTTLLPALFVVWSSKREEPVEEVPQTLPLPRTEETETRIVPRRAG